MTVKKVDPTAKVVASDTHVIPGAAGNTGAETPAGSAGVTPGAECQYTRI
jgi:hypothetical protein